MVRCWLEIRKRSTAVRPASGRCQDKGIPEAFPFFKSSSGAVCKLGDLGAGPIISHPPPREISGNRAGISTHPFQHAATFDGITRKREAIIK
jgi:hypothetical protein